MNLFEYKARVKELEMCKLVKDLEAFVRRYNSKLNKYYRISLEDKYYYKLYALSLKLFKTKSNKKLPDFIYSNYKEAQQSVLISLFEAHLVEKRHYIASQEFTQKPTYEEFRDWFEFDTHLELYPSYWHVEQFNSIIGANPVHFTVTFNYNLDAFGRESTTLILEQQILAYAIRHKQVNFPDKPQTIWDMFIVDSISKAGNILKPDVNKDITKLKQQIKALEALPEYLS